jgi:hypothetical protein
MNEFCINCFEVIYHNGHTSVREFSQNTDILNEHAVLVLRVCRSLLAKAIANDMEVIGHLTDGLGGYPSGMSAMESFLEFDPGSEQDSNESLREFTSEELRDMLANIDFLVEIVRFFVSQKIFM